MNDLRVLVDHEWMCPSCSHHLDGDLNAAVNIKAAGIAFLVSGERVSHVSSIGISSFRVNQGSPPFPEGKPSSMLSVHINMDFLIAVKKTDHGSFWSVRQSAQDHHGSFVFASIAEAKPNKKYGGKPALRHKCRSLLTLLGSVDTRIRRIQAESVGQ